MDKNQKIHCTICNCKYNNENTNICELASIKVTPTPNTEVENADESMCSNYKCNC